MKKFLLSIALAMVAVCAICLAACAKPESVDKPVVQQTEFVYNGTEVTLLSDGEFYTVSGNKATNAGSYTATVTLSDKKKYTWSDGTTNDVTINWTINKAKIAKPAATSTEYTYNGSEVTVIDAATGYSVIGNKATDAGSYTAKATLSDKENYAWSDGTTDDVTINWTINKAKIAKPVATSTEYTYSGSEVTVIEAATGYTVSVNKATDVGSYTAKAMLTDTLNYIWADGTTDDVSITWSIKKLSVAIPTVPDDLVYTGNAITALQDNDYYTVTDGTKTDAGNYLLSLGIKDMYNLEWADGTTSIKRIPWSIAKAQYDTSSLVFENVTYVYDGNPHTLTIQGLPEGVAATYSTNTLTEVGTLEVTATFTVSSNYEQTEIKANLTVTQAQNSLITDFTDLKIYDSEKQALVSGYNGDTVSINVASAFGIPAVTYYTLVEEDNYDALDAQPVNAGTYYVRASVDGTVNYAAFDSEYVKYVIEKANYDISGVTYVTEFEFDGDEKTVQVANLPAGVTSSVSQSSMVPCELEVTVTFSSTNENYNDIEPVTKTLVVTKKVVLINTYDELQNALLNDDLNFLGIGQHIIYKLANDIDCNNQAWTTVGNYNKPFSSNLDGDGHTISNMLVDETSGEYLETGGGILAYAMFGSLAEAATIHDIVFENFNVKINTNRATGGNYYAFICGRIPNASGNTVELYNITVQNSLISINDSYGNKTRLGCIFGWDYSDDSKRENLLVKDTDIVFIGEPNNHNDGSAPNGTCYIGGFVGEIDGNASNGLGRSYTYTDCKFEGGTITVCSKTTKAPHVGGIFGYVIGKIKLTNVTSDADIYRFCGEKEDAVISEVTLEVTDSSDETVKSLTNWIGRADNSMPTPEISGCSYTGTAQIFKNLTFAESTVIDEETIEFSMELPEVYEIKYFNGETEATQISKDDFGDEESITITAIITFNSEQVYSFEQTFTLKQEEQPAPAPEPDDGDDTGNGGTDFDN